jgi:hypothetical protein
MSFLVAFPPTFYIQYLEAQLLSAHKLLLTIVTSFSKQQ